MQWTYRPPKPDPIKEADEQLLRLALACLKWTVLAFLIPFGISVAVDLIFPPDGFPAVVTGSVLGAMFATIVIFSYLISAITSR